jgi:hypothetical protein
VDGLGFSKQGKLSEMPGPLARSRPAKGTAVFRLALNAIPGYPETLNLKTMVHIQSVVLRPEVELEPTEHPLSVEQRHGITWERLNQIASIANHHVGG